MANRSDFYNAKLPRSIKRMLIMGDVNGWNGNKHQSNQIKRQFISAHASHVGFKLKRQSMESGGEE